MIDIWLCSWPDIWLYDRLVLLLCKLCTACYTNTGGMLIDSTLYYILLLLQFYCCYFSSSTFHISSFVCSLYARASFPLFLYTHWGFWLSGFAHPGLCMLSYWSVIWRGSQTSWGARVFLLDRPFLVYYLLSYSYYFHDSVHLHSVLVLFLYSYAIMYKNLYVILQWCWFFIMIL